MKTHIEMFLHFIVFEEIHATKNLISPFQKHVLRDL